MRWAGRILQIYRHKGLNYSIFESGQQIAAFAGNRVTVGKGGKFVVRMNGDSSLLRRLLFVCIVLAVDTAERHNDGESSVTINAGSVGPEERPFNSSWQPR
jgi:hypothetical protein